MSVKHVKKYFDKISNDYVEMLDTLHELEEAVAQNIISQETLDATAKSVEQLKDNYLRWSYMIYLLNQPNKKDKQQVYQKRMSKVLKEIPENCKIENTFKENRQNINTLKADIQNIKNN